MWDAEIYAVYLNVEGGTFYNNHVIVNEANSCPLIALKR